MEENRSRNIKEEIELYPGEIQGLREDSALLIKIRNDLSSVPMALHFADAAVVGPQGIYDMVMELKRLYEERQQFLIRLYAEAGGSPDIDVNLFVQSRELLGGEEKARELAGAYDEALDAGSRDV